MAFTGWPVVVGTTNVDQGSDSPATARNDIYNALAALNQIIEGRGAANGIATLNSSGDVPLAQLNTNAASGICGLTTAARVPLAQSNIGQYLAPATGTTLTAEQHGALVNVSGGTIYLPTASAGLVGTTYFFVNTDYFTKGTIARKNPSTEYIRGAVGRQLNYTLLPGLTVALQLVAYNTWQIIHHQSMYSGWAEIDGTSVTGYSIPNNWTNAERAGTGLITFNHNMTLDDVFDTDFRRYFHIRAASNLVGGYAEVYGAGDDDFFQIGLRDDAGTLTNGSAFFDCTFEQGFFNKNS